MKLVKEYINEKFTKDSDPIEDMGIGRNHWYEKIKEIFIKEYFDSESDVETYMDIAQNTLEELYQLGLSEEKAADICYNDNPDFLTELEEIWNNKWRAAPNDDLKANCRSFQDSGTEEDAKELANYLINRHLSYDYDEDELRMMAYDWVGYDPTAEGIDEALNEIFTEESDPIKDMGIGMRPIIKAWLDAHHIKSYHIKKDLTISVNNSVNLNSVGLTNFPEYIQFDKIYGDFDIAHNKLTSLRGCPNYVRDNFWCLSNRLTSLDYAPKKVGMVFNCWNNLQKFTYKKVLKICDVGTEVIADDGVSDVRYLAKKYK